MNPVQSISRAFSLLESIAHGPVGLTQVARDVELPMSTVARLLSTLEELGAVVRDANSRYTIGPAIHALGHADPDAALVARARPHLETLVVVSGETAGVSVLDGEMVRYLDHVEANNDVQIRDWSGERCPLHVTSSGQVLLAGASPATLARYLAGSLEARASRTITAPSALRRRIAEVARDGYSVTVQEFSDDISSAAAPIRDDAGQTVAAIHVHGPAYRFPTGEARAELIRALTAAAAALSAPRHGPRESEARIGSQNS
jgi:DNA-binding IclR family transcriptional regulator